MYQHQAISKLTWACTSQWALNTWLTIHSITIKSQGLWKHTTILFCSLGRSLFSMWNCFQIWWIWPKPARQRESGRKFRIWWRWRAVSPGRRARFTQNQNENLPLPLCHTVHTRVAQEDGKFRCNPRVQGSHSNWKAWFAELYFCAKWMFSLHRLSMQPWEDSQAGVDLCCIPPPSTAPLLPLSQIKLCSRGLLVCSHCGGEKVPVARVAPEFSGCTAGNFISQGRLWLSIGFSSRDHFCRWQNVPGFHFLYPSLGWGWLWRY